MELSSAHGLFSNGNLSVNIKFISIGFDDLKHHLVATCKIINLVFLLPVKVKGIAEALIHRDICIFGQSKLLNVDEVSVFTGGVIKFIL